MSDREKLAEIVKGASYRCLPSNTTDFHLERFVTDLLSFGVTIQRWIPVSERLPEPFVPVLVQMPGEAPSPTVREGSISRDGIWHSALYHREPDEITHWMPLPEPPKGD